MPIYNIHYHGRGLDINTQLPDTPPRGATHAILQDGDGHRLDAIAGEWTRRIDRESLSRRAATVLALAAQGDTARARQAERQYAEHSDATLAGGWRMPNGTSVASADDAIRAWASERR